MDSNKTENIVNPFIDELIQPSVPRYSPQFVFYLGNYHICLY